MKKLTPYTAGVIAGQVKAGTSLPAIDFTGMSVGELHQCIETMKELSDLCARVLDRRVFTQDTQPGLTLSTQPGCILDEVCSWADWQRQKAIPAMEAAEPVDSFERSMRTEVLAGWYGAYEQWDKLRDLVGGLPE